MADIKLTEEEISEFKEVYHMIDRDGGGSISIKEIGDLMRALDMDPPEDELQELFTEIDTDGNGDIDFAEFVTLMARKKNVEEELREAFHYLEGTTMSDPNLITHDKIKKLYLKLGIDLPDEEINDMMLEADVDKDGLVEWEDFYAMFDVKKQRNEDEN
jgi:Ca2+-binding EF-hand superfamily protein